MWCQFLDTDNKADVVLHAEELDLASGVAKEADLGFGCILIEAGPLDNGRSVSLKNVIPA